MDVEETTSSTEENTSSETEDDESTTSTEETTEVETAPIVQETTTPEDSFVGPINEWIKEEEVRELKRFLEGSMNLFNYA